MLWLLVLMLITGYISLFVANIIKFNNEGILAGRVFFAAIIPIIHFVELPIGLLYKAIQHRAFFRTLRVMPTMILLYPVVLAEYAYRAKPLNATQRYDLKDDIYNYETVSEGIVAMPC